MIVLVMLTDAYVPMDGENSCKPRIDKQGSNTKNERDSSSKTYADFEHDLTMTLMFTIS